MPSPYDQSPSRIRFEWGPVGAAETAPGSTYAVVVDVLSFTTTLSVGMDLGTAVLPYAWRDESAGEYAAAHDAVLAVGRLEARDAQGLVSLSPAALRASSGIERLVLPSPNGSTISAALSAGGSTVLGLSLRNTSAVSAWLAERLLSDPAATLVVVAAGERWRGDSSLRPCVEDALGAGALLAALVEAGVDGLSPEADHVRRAFRGSDVAASVRASSSGRELVENGFGDDVEVALELDASAWVPVLREGSFVRAGRAAGRRYRT